MKAGRTKAALTVLQRSPLALLATGLLLFVWLRRGLLQRLGGTTGDTAGALVELGECAALLALALSL